MPLLNFQKIRFKILPRIQTLSLFLLLNFDIFSGLQKRCGVIFGLLAKAACSEQSISRLRRTKDVLRLKLQNKATNLHTSHALSMEVLLVKAIELGSHGIDCWPHVFT